MAVHGRASNGALPFCFGIVAALPVRSYYLVTPEHRNRHPVATGRTLATEPYGKMTPRLPDGHQIFPVFPECPLSPFPPIVFLPGSAGDQFNGIGNCFAIRIISNKQMNVIRCDCIVEDYQTISLPCFKKPGQPSPSVFGKF
jgi:hypothetical protein